MTVAAASIRGSTVGGLSSVVAPDPASAALAAVTDLRAARRRRRLGDVAWGDLAYRVYTTALAVLVLVVFASGLVGDDRLSGAAADRVLDAVPAWAGLLAAAFLLIGVRSGARGGPLAMEAADVHHLLLAPLPRSAALRRPALGMVGYGAAGGAAVGALAGELFSQRLPGSGTAWAGAGALFGATTVTLSLGAAMVTASRRLPRRVPLAVALGLLAWSAGDATGGLPTAPLTWVGRMVTWPVRSAPVAAVAVPIAIGTAVVGLAVVGGLSIEAARRRTALVGQLRFAVTQQDLRSVVLLRRQLAAEVPRRRTLLPRLPVAVGRRWPVFDRDLRSIARWPAVRIVRVIVLVTGAAFALGGVLSGTTPLLLVAGICTFVAALDAVEPLAQEVDHPTLLGSYPRPAGAILLAHLAAPVMVLAVAGAVALGAAMLLEPSTDELALGAITLVSGSFAAVAGAAISVVGEISVQGSDSVMFSPEVAGPTVVLRTLWPPAVAVLGLVPVLVAQRAVRDGGDLVPPAATAALLSLALTALVFTWVRRREDWHRSMDLAMKGADR